MKNQIAIKIEIHERALRIVGQYKRAESDLIDILQSVEKHKVYQSHQCKSLYEYATRVLKLSESVAYNFIVVSRKATEVPELKAAIATGVLSVSKARKITPVLNKVNHSQWLSNATQMSQKKLEHEVAKACPREAVPERMKFVSEDRLNLQLGISSKIMHKFKQVQNLESRRNRRAVNLEETLEALLDQYLESMDPVQKAEKIRNRKNLSLRRRLDLRDGGRCTFTDSGGVRCKDSRWLDVHHVVPRSKGGLDTLENLTTLCSGHHRLVHAH